MSEQITQETLDQSANVANDLLKQDGWAIVEQLALALNKGIKLTATVIMPIQVKLEEYKSKLDDAEGFVKAFNTLKHDVATATEILGATINLHVGKSGQPTESDLPKLQQITLAYSELQNVLDRAITPLMLALVQTLEEAGITDLSIEE